MIPAARIITSADGRYRRDPSGRPAIIWPVRDSERELVDTVAWHVETPTRWWMLYGDDCPLLGARQLAIARYFGDAIELHPTPQHWLLAHRRGVVILRWDVDYADTFEGVGAVHCCNSEFEHRFQQALRAWEPDIVVGTSRVFIPTLENELLNRNNTSLMTGNNDAAVREVRHVA